MRLLFLLLFFTFPTCILSAAGGAGTLEEILNMFIAPSGLLFQFIRVSVGIALIVFIWGVVRMVLGMQGGESDKVIAEGKKRMVWGLIGLFVLISIWGIVAILVTIFGTTGATPTPPIIVP